MKRALTWIGIGLLVIMIGLAVYGIAIEPRLWLDERHYRAELSAVPTELAGTRIAVFSDLQVGMWWANTGMVERVVERVVDVEPDAVLLAGDFVYSTAPDPPAQVDHVVDLLQPLFDHDIATFAVMGNHDHAVGAVDLLVERLEAEGVRVLRNDAARLSLDGANLWVVGIGSHGYGNSRPERAFDDVPPDAPRVVVMHNPASFPEIGGHRAPLAVAGHTHCGQIALPGTPTWSYMQLRAQERVVVDGFAPPAYGSDGNRLFVNCGIGFSLVPARIGAPPQLVFFELAVGEAPQPSFSRSQ